MSFAARLIHDLTHVRLPLDDRTGQRDTYGQPTPGTEVRTAVKGLVQPRAGDEVPDSRDAGSALSDHVIFLQPMALFGSDWFEYGGERYDIRNVRTFAFGTEPHLEVDAHRVAHDLPTGSLEDAEGS